MKNTAHPVMLLSFLKFIKFGFVPPLTGWAKIGIFSSSSARGHRLFSVKNLKDDG
jgi:hypothetical protein